MCSNNTQIFKMMMDDLTMWKSNIKFVSIAFCQVINIPHLLYAELFHDNNIAQPSNSEPPV